jgi:hypothetical protein
VEGEGEVDVDVDVYMVHGRRFVAVAGKRMMSISR